jgi:hypothetical protein
VSDNVVARIGDIARLYGEAFEVEAWARDLFAEEVRGRSRRPACLAAQHLSSIVCLGRTLYVMCRDMLSEAGVSNLHLPSLTCCSQVVRGGPAFSISLVITAIEPALRNAAALGAWQVGPA